MNVPVRTWQEHAPLAVVDVHYTGTSAMAACAVARGWTDEIPSQEQTTVVPAVRPYRPGAFFERELPCILQVLSLVRTEYRAIVIDGYVDLDERGTPGLGGHLYAHLQGSLAVIGVAKTAYHGSTFAAGVLRGSSRRPLFVTARGIPLDQAAYLVQQMHGKDRIPTLIKRVDSLARGKPLSPSLGRSRR
jgi:deoxyribonuclease V